MLWSCGSVELSAGLGPVWKALCCLTDTASSCSWQLSLCHQWERACGRESRVKKAILTCAGQKGESLAFKCLTIKPHLPPASLRNTHSLLPTLLFAWPKDVKISLAKRRKKKEEKKIQTLEYFIVNRKCANWCFYVDFARWWNRRLGTSLLNPIFPQAWVKLEWVELYSCETAWNPCGSLGYHSTTNN